MFRNSAFQCRLYWSEYTNECFMNHNKVNLNRYSVQNGNATRLSFWWPTYLKRWMSTTIADAIWWDLLHCVIERKYMHMIVYWHVPNWNECMNFVIGGHGTRSETIINAPSVGLLRRWSATCHAFRTGSGIMLCFGRWTQTHLAHCTPKISCSASHLQLLTSAAANGNDNVVIVMFLYISNFNRKSSFDLSLQLGHTFRSHDHVYPVPWMSVWHVTDLRNRYDNMSW